MRTLSILALAIMATLPNARAADGTGLTGTYYPTQDFAGVPQVRTDALINFSWGEAGPGLAGIGPHQFSVRWAGQIQSAASETYTFSTTSDDGIIVVVDGRTVIRNWTAHSATENGGTMALTAGRRYDIRIFFFEAGGPATASLAWSSPSTPKEIIPTRCLYPDTAQHLAAVSPAASRTSPAWLEGSFPAAATALTVVAGGHTATCTRESPDTWFASSAPAPGPLGIPLTAGASTHVTLATTGDQAETASIDLTWTVTDLTNLPYGLVKLPVRAGDQLLLAASGSGTKVELDTDYDGTTFHPILTGTPASRFATTFATPGDHIVAARRDGVLTGRLTVSAITVALDGPIACEQYFQRVKDVIVTPAAAATSLVSFTGADADWLTTGVTSATPLGAQLTLMPMAKGAHLLQARLGEAGPVIAQQRVDAFTIVTSASQSIHVYTELPDGSQLAEATLTMSPLIPDLDVTIHTFVSGVTFDDSTTTRTVSTSAFIAAGADGTYDYHLLRAPTGYAHFCHNRVVTQRGVQVSF